MAASDRAASALKAEKRAARRSGNPAPRRSTSAAALLAASGRTHVACGVASKTDAALSVSCERAAVLRAAADGDSKFVGLVVADAAEEALPVPDGAARQVLAEYGDFPVYLVNRDLRARRVTTHELFPLRLAAGRSEALGPPAPTASELQDDAMHRHVAMPARDSLGRRLRPRLARSNAPLSAPSGGFSRPATSTDCSVRTRARFPQVADAVRQTAAREVLRPADDPPLKKFKKKKRKPIASDSDSPSPPRRRRAASSDSSDSSDSSAPRRRRAASASSSSSDEDVPKRRRASSSDSEDDSDAPNDRPTTPTDWSVDHVCAWIQKISKPEHAAVFRRAKVDGALLAPRPSDESLPVGPDFANLALKRTAPEQSTAAKISREGAAELGSRRRRYDSTVKISKKRYR